MRLSPDEKRGVEKVTGQALNSNGTSGKSIWGESAKWVYYWGTINDKAVGIAIFDHPSNLRHPTAWHAREYGLVAANPFGLHYKEAVQAIRTLVHPAPVIAVHMSKTAEEPPPNTDIVLSGPTDLDKATKQIMEELKKRGVLAQAIGTKPTFQYSI